MGLTLPDGRRFRVDATVAPRLCAGVLVLDPVRVDGGDGPAAEIDRLGEELRARHSGAAPGGIPGLAEARSLYRSFGMDPTRHRPSSEALLRRMLQGKGLYRINNLVDSCNLASLSFLLPVGLYDLGSVVGDVIVRTGGPGESYPGIRKGPVNLEGRLGLFDKAGPFGSPTSDSARTCTGPGTTSVLAVIMATGSFPRRDMEANIDLFAAVFARHCAGVEAMRSLCGGTP